MRCDLRDNSQRGAALLYAVLIVALAGAISLKSAARIGDSASRLSLFADSDQARRYSLATELLARKLLSLDAEHGNIDHLGEEWASKDRPIDIDGAHIVGNIVDLQGKFNVNGLWREGQLDPDAVELFDRLVLNATGMQGLSTQLAEWTSAVIVQMSGASGDSPYLQASPPYLRPLRPMASVSEVRLLSGVDASAYARLEPYLVALPMTTLVNVNTVGSGLLGALSPNLDSRTVDELISRREQFPFATVDSFKNAVAEIAGPVVAADLNLALLTVSSNFFLVDGDVRYGSGRARFRTVIFREDDGRTSVLSRSWGSP